MRVKFTDGPDVVDLQLASGLVVVERGKPIDLPADTARELINEHGWTNVQPPRKRAAAKKAPAKPKPRKGAES